LFAPEGGEVGGLFSKPLGLLELLVLPVLELVKVVDFFSFVFMLFLVASKDFQVLAREEWWVLVDFR
jgi:hypothetical protein